MIAAKPACLDTRRCSELLNILDNNPDEESTLKDVIVPAGERMTFLLTPGGYLRCRDIIVLGELNITMDDDDSLIEERFLEKGETIPQIFARNVYNFGSIRSSEAVFNVDYIADLNLRDFQGRLITQIIDWILFQRETVEKIGLRSVLL